MWGVPLVDEKNCWAGKEKSSSVASLQEGLSSFRNLVKVDSESASGKRHANPEMAMGDVMSLLNITWRKFGEIICFLGFANEQVAQLLR